MTMKVKSIRPLYTGVITTTNRYTEDNSLGGVLIDNKKTAGAVKEYQTVLKVGTSVREVKPGDVVLINPTRYTKKKFSEDSLRADFVDNPVIEINIPTVQLEDQEVFMIEERDIAYVIEEFEEVEDTSVNIIQPKPVKIITN